MCAWWLSPQGRSKGGNRTNPEKELQTPTTGPRRIFLGKGERERQKGGGDSSFSNLSSLLSLTPPPSPSRLRETQPLEESVVCTMGGGNAQKTAMARQKKQEKDAKAGAGGGGTSGIKDRIGNTADKQAQAKAEREAKKREKEEREVAKKAKEEADARRLAKKAAGK